jgi:acyl dehydratase
MITDDQHRLQTAFAAPADDRYFEDYVPGSVYEFGTVRVDQAEAIAFASRYDPQEKHMNPEAAVCKAAGGVIVSGWFVLSLMMRLYVDNCLSSVANLGSPGIEKLRWHLPVCAGDLLSIRVTIEKATRSHSKGERGTMRHRIEVLNQRRELVLSVLPITLVRCRPVR